MRVTSAWSPRLPALLAGAMTAAVDAVYLAIIRAEAVAWVSARVAFVAAFLAAGCGLALAGAVTADPRRRVLVLGASSGALASAGLLGIFSIGLLLLVAAVPAAVAWARSARDPRLRGSRSRLGSVGAALAAPAILVLGVALT